MQQLGEELATPNENHQFLSSLAGVWNTTTTIIGMQPEKGDAQYAMIFDNRFLEGTHSGTVANIPYKGKLTIGFDNCKQKFVSTFIDNLSTTIHVAEGVLDKKSSTLSLWGTMDEWMTGEHDKLVLYRFIVHNEDSYTFEMHDLSLLSNPIVITTIYTKAKTIDKE